MELNNFSRDVLEASQDRPVLVDFFATWCGPCRMLAPVLEQLATQEAIQVVTVNTDQHQELAARHQVSGIPDLRLYFQGREIAQMSGFRPLPQLRQWLHEQLTPEKSMGR